MEFTKIEVLERLIEKKSILSNLNNELSEVELEYSEEEALIKLLIWSNKSYLKTCSFASKLSSDQVVDLSNDTLRNSALVLAKRYDSIFSTSHKRVVELRMSISSLKSVIERYELLLKIFDETGVSSLQFDPNLLF